MLSCDEESRTEHEVRGTCGGIHQLEATLRPADPPTSAVFDDNYSTVCDTSVAIGKKPRMHMPFMLVLLRDETLPSCCCTSERPRGSDVNQILVVLGTLSSSLRSRCVRDVIAVSQTPGTASIIQGRELVSCWMSVASTFQGVM
jgi:hypothetical protein